MHNPWQIEAIGSEDNGLSRSGEVSRPVRGVVRYQGLEIATYIVHGAPAHVAERGAIFDLIVDSWRDATARIERCAVSLACRLVREQPSFRVIDSADRDIAKSDLVTCLLKAADLRGDPLAGDIFTICEVIIALDERVTNLLGRTNR